MGRRRYVRAVGGAVALGGLAPSAAAADCGATAYANTTEGGEPKLAVPSGDATITGESTCGPGTSLTVRARNTGDDVPFLTSAITTVGDTGGWSVTFDMGHLDPGTTFELAVLHDDGDQIGALHNCEVVSDAPSPEPTPSQRPTRTESPTPTRPPTETPSPICTDCNSPPGPTPTETPTPTSHTDPPASASPAMHGLPAGGSGDGLWSGWTRLLLAPVLPFLALAALGLLAVAAILARWKLADA